MDPASAAQIAGSPAVELGRAGGVPGLAKGAASAPKEAPLARSATHMAEFYGGKGVHGSLQKRGAVPARDTSAQTLPVGETFAAADGLSLLRAACQLDEAAATAATAPSAALLPSRGQPPPMQPPQTRRAAARIPKPLAQQAAISEAPQAASAGDRSTRTWPTTLASLDEARLARVEQANAEMDRFTAAQMERSEVGGPKGSITR